MTNQSAQTNAVSPPTRPLPGRLLRGLGTVVGWCGLALLTAWAAAALYFDVRIPWLSAPLAGAYVLALADIPVAPAIRAHSIIPVKNDGDLQRGRDGVVAYTSAHVDYVASELVVRGGHSCQNLPATIEEVRRILHEHLRQLDLEPDGIRKQSRPDPVNHGRTNVPFSLAEVMP